MPKGVFSSLFCRKNGLVCSSSKPFKFADLICSEQPTLILVPVYNHFCFLVIG